MAIINFENMKATEPDRNFDNVNVDENYNIGLQNGQGFYGAGKFFGLVQKAVNWISTITGNKNFTGTLSVNSKEVATTESVNNALANQGGTITPITTNDSAVTIICGGFSRIGKMIICNFRFSVNSTNLLNFETNLPNPMAQEKQYIPVNVINIQEDLPELCYGYKPHSNSRILVKVPKVNVEYAMSFTYISQ